MLWPIERAMPEPLLIACFLIPGMQASDGRTDGCDFDELRSELANFPVHSEDDQSTNDVTICIQNDYEIRRKVLGPQIAFDLIDSIAGFAAIPPLLALSGMFGPRVMETSIFVPAFAGAALIGALELVGRAGRSTAADWMSGDDWNLDSTGLRVLWYTDFISQSDSLWLFALDELLLAIGLIAIASATFRFGVLPTWHAYVGAGAGTLAFINFCLELARFGNWRLFSVIGGISIAVVGFILYPVWLVLLGCYLAGTTEGSTNQQSLMTSTERFDRQTGASGDDAMFSGAAAGDMSLGAAGDSVGDGQL